jgi:UDP-2,3-diacylglucosamine hydrolase
MKPSVYFISDVHLGIYIDGCEQRQEALFSFFEEIKSDASDLYIIGDLFDFWVEYNRVIRSDYFIAISHLRQLVEAGINVHYLAGNHDFAIGPFLVNIVGLTIHHNHLLTTIQGKKVHLYHGDGLVKKDWGYRILKRILRNKINQTIYKSIHPDIGIGLASFFSGSSRKMLARWMTEEKLEEYRQIAKTYLLESDYVLIGHTHKAEINRFEKKVYINTGEWIRKYTYAKMIDGKINLFQWFGNQPAIELH